MPACSCTWLPACLPAYMCSRVLGVFLCTLCRCLPVCPCACLSSSLISHLPVSSPPHPHSPLLLQSLTPCTPTIPPPLALLSCLQLRLWKKWEDVAREYCAKMSKKAVVRESQAESQHCTIPQCGDRTALRCTTLMSLHCAGLHSFHCPALC